MTLKQSLFGGILAVFLIGCSGMESIGEDGFAELGWNNRVNRRLDNTTQGVLVADSSKDAYSLIVEQGFGFEVPDVDMNVAGSHPGFRHVQQRFDPALGRDVFAFYLHHNNDITDNDVTGGSGRQRSEIKTWGPSPEWGKARDGQTHTYRWKFMLPEGFVASAQFTHIHQLKAVDLPDVPQDSSPTITLTPRRRAGENSVPEMQLIYRAPMPSNNIYLIERIPLSGFLGEWVEVEQTVHYSAINPSYEFQAVRLSDGAELMRFRYEPDAWTHNAPFVTMRPGNDFVRPKWGIYRQYLEADGSPVAGPLRDEVVLFADFQIIRDR